MINTPLLETKYKVQKQFDEEAQHDVERYTANSHRIVCEVEAKYGVKFKYGTVQGGPVELLPAQVKNTQHFVAVESP